MTTPDTPAPRIAMDHLVILVRHLEVSMPYYDALLPLLGLAKVRDHVWRDGSGCVIQFLAAREDTRDYERYGPGLNHVGFGAPDVATVERVRATMAAAGFAVPEIQHLGGATALFMKDPDGIRFELTHYAPGTSVVD